MPNYSDKELAKIKADNHKGFEYEGKHYTIYEGSQLQRKLETEVRYAKEEQLTAAAYGDTAWATQAQNKVRVLKEKYVSVSEAAGLPVKSERMGVSGYRANKGVRKAVDNSGRSGIINTGARNPYSEAATKHAEQYYEAVRKFRTDVKRISQNTGISVDEINRIKQYLFIDEHDLSGKVERFAPDYMIAQSWQRLLEGKSIQPHDLTLLQHEKLEYELMKNGMSQDEAHIIASSKYNYSKEAMEYYGKIKKHKKE